MNKLIDEAATQEVYSIDYVNSAREAFQSLFPDLSKMDEDCAGLGKMTKLDQVHLKRVGQLEVCMFSSMPFFLRGGIPPHESCASGVCEADAFSCRLSKKESVQAVPTLCW